MAFNLFTKSLDKIGETKVSYFFVNFLDNFFISNFYIHNFKVNKSVLISFHHKIEKK